eukprot:530460-Rhodomonas_salina.1
MPRTQCAHTVSGRGPTCVQCTSTLRPAARTSSMNLTTCARSMHFTPCPGTPQCLKPLIRKAFDPASKAFTPCPDVAREVLARGIVDIERHICEGLRKEVVGSYRGARRHSAGQYRDAGSSLVLGVGSSRAASGSSIGSRGAGASSMYGRSLVQQQHRVGRQRRTA